jgi:phosphoserine phosphatase
MRALQWRQIQLVTRRDPRLSMVEIDPMTYAEHHAALVAYLLVKVEARDWHGVSDAANDLRVLEAGKPEPTIRPDAEPQRMSY